jgi:hypothetical protein
MTFYVAGYYVHVCRSVFAKDHAIRSLTVVQ